MRGFLLVEPSPTRGNLRLTGLPLTAPNLSAVSAYEADLADLGREDFRLIVAF